MAPAQTPAQTSAVGIPLLPRFFRFALRAHGYSFGISSHSPLALALVALFTLSSEHYTRVTAKVFFWNISCFLRIFFCVNWSLGYRSVSTRFVISRQAHHSGAGIIISFGDLTGILRANGSPLHERYMMSVGASGRPPRCAPTCFCMSSGP